MTAQHPESRSSARKAAVIKKSVAGIGHGMSRGAERVANIILDEDQAAQGLKTRKIADETLIMFKDVSSQLRSDLKGVKPRDFVSVAAYSAGRGAAIARGALKNIFGLIP